MYNPGHVPLRYRGNYRPDPRPYIPNGWAVLLALDLIERITKIRHKPQLTLVLIGGMCLVHFWPEVLLSLLPSGWQTQLGDSPNIFYNPAIPGLIVQELCMYPTAMLQGFQWSGIVHGLGRFFFSALIHGDHWHLFYNMGSFLAKGALLEPKMGTKAYAGLLAYSLVTSQALLFLLSWILMAWFGFAGPMHTCTVGFSGVLLALKFVLNRHGYGTTEMLGFSVRTRYATWAELVVVWLFVPYSSLLGLLSGVLAGVLFTEMPVLLPFLRLVPAMIGLQSKRPGTYGHGTVGGGGQAHRAHASRAGANRGTYSSAPNVRARARYDEAASEERDTQEALYRSMTDARAGVRSAPRHERVRGDLGDERQGYAGEATSVAPSAPTSEDLVHDDHGDANGLRRRVPSSVEL